MKMPSRLSAVTLSNNFFAGLALFTLLLIPTAIVVRAQTQVQVKAATIRQQAELNASDRQPSDYFGGAVSLSGNRALIGGGLSSPTDEGAAYVFIFDGTSWSQEAKLTPSDGKPFDFFGGSVSLSGNRALIGGGLADRNKGAAYTFVFDGTNWNQEAKIVPSDLRNNDNFGSSVSLSGNRALIGASAASSSSAPGKAYVFVFDGTTWTQEAKLVPDHQTNLDFGVSVSLSGNRALIGADQSPHVNGKAYVFAFDGTTWKQETELTASDGQANDRFARSVSLSGNRALIGADQLQQNPPAPGKAYIFAFDGVSWNQEVMLTSSDGQSTDNFGNSVSLAGKRALIGASQLDANGGLGGAGAAYLFVFDGTTWVQKSKLTASNGQVPDAFGSAVSLWKNRALIGANRADDKTGTAYIFAPVGRQESSNLAPSLIAIYPDNQVAGGTDFLLTLSGTNFVNTSTVQWNGSARATTFVDDAILVATITAADIATGGTASVTVTNPPPGGGTSNSIIFTINNPVPIEVLLSPSSETAGDSAFTLTVSGTLFVSTSVVQWNGSARPTTFVSSTTLTAAISAADIANGGAVSVTVMNPAPGGGTSNSNNFTINNPVPTATSLSPASGTAGGPQFTLRVNGTNFVQGSVVKWKGATLTTTFVDSTKVTAIVPASNIATVGTANVTVANPAPGGGTSGSLSFTINNPVPTATTLTPSSTIAGSSAFTLKVTGTNFVATSKVQWNGHNRTTTFVNSTVLNASILDTDIAQAGTVAVTVFNPTPGGGTSAALTFTVNNPVPHITNISPNNATAGGPPFTLTVNGTNFVKTSAVNWNGTALNNPHFVSSTQLTVNVPAANIANAGTASVTVTNPTPGGGASNAVTLAINNPVPNLTSLTPSKKNHGGTDFTLTVHGAGLVPTSQVKWNGSNRTTTFVNGGQVQAAITAADIANAGTAQLTVTNPGPGGGTSNALTFTIN